MRGLPIAAVFLAACGLALANPSQGPDNNPPIFPEIVVPPDDIAGVVIETPPPPPVTLTDADRDGYIVTIDCNDANPLANPIALERANGVDDNCDGVVDDGFDTTIDWPHVVSSTVIWPRPGITPAGYFLSTAAQPRLVWAEDRFMAVWTDAKERLRVARIGRDGSLLGAAVYLPRPVRNVDVAWTGSQLGIVYEYNVTETPSLRLLIVDRDGVVQDDLVLVAVGSDPKIAWGQDRFGVVWKAPTGVNALRFQRFSETGRPLSGEETLENSGRKAAIAFSGTTVTQLEGGPFLVREGMFGITYDAHYALVASGDVLLSMRPRDADRHAPLGPFQVNQHDDPYTSLGAIPTIAANASGFAVGWHTNENGLDRAQARVFSLNGLTPVQEFTPDRDAARYGRMTWTGGEFVMVNDNRTCTTADEFDVHIRRIDASGNPHPATGTGPWTELNLRDMVQGSVSAHPDVANTGEVLGVAWIEGDPASEGRVGRLWLAIVAHK